MTAATSRSRANARPGRYRHCAARQPSRLRSALMLSIAIANVVDPGRPAQRPQEVPYSRLICWVAIERAIRLATDPPGADQRRVQPRSCPGRVNRQDLVMTAHPPSGEARFEAKGSHGHEGAPGNTRRSEPR
jgi:hypothetical protein